MPPRGPSPVPCAWVSQDAERLSAGLRVPRPEVGRFVVIRPSRMRDTDAEGTDCLVVTDDALAAVAATAALLGTLRRRGRSPRRARVVIAGAARMPMLCPLLTTAGISAANYDEQGTRANGTFVDYTLPSAADLPTFDTPVTSNPLGVKGVGEAGTIPSTP